jgi:hypothetical protein
MKGNHEGKPECAYFLLPTVLKILENPSGVNKIKEIREAKEEN